jgi:site-specific DNA recombinase
MPEVIAQRAQRAILYGRYSPRPEDCDSVEKQFEEMERWCAARGIEVVAKYCDKAVSGKKRNRPGLFSALKECRKGDVLLVREWDRFSRDRLFAGMLIEDLKHKGIEVRSITENGDLPETSESRLLQNILLDIAEYRREIIAERTRAAMKRHVKNGRYMGRDVPFGYKIGPWKEEGGERYKTIIKNELEQAALRRLHYLRGLKMRYSDIAKLMNSDGFPCRGKRWRGDQVKKYLTRDESSLP